jgi:hypothetical protein
VTVIAPSTPEPTVDDILAALSIEAAEEHDDV